MRNHIPNDNLARPKSWEVMKGQHSPDTGFGHAAPQSPWHCMVVAAPKTYLCCSTSQAFIQTLMGLVNSCHIPCVKPYFRTTFQRIFPAIPASMLHSIPSKSWLCRHARASGHWALRGSPCNPSRHWILQVSPGSRPCLQGSLAIDLPSPQTKDGCQLGQTWALTECRSHAVNVFWCGNQERGKHL